MTQGLLRIKWINSCLCESVWCVKSPLPEHSWGFSSVILSYILLELKNLSFDEPVYHFLIAYYDLGVLGGKVLIYEACSPNFHPVKTFVKLKCIVMACIFRILLGAFILMCSVINWLEIRYGKVTSPGCFDMNLVVWVAWALSVPQVNDLCVSSFPSIHFASFVKSLPHPCN